MKVSFGTNGLEMFLVCNCCLKFVLFIGNFINHLCWNDEWKNFLFQNCKYFLSFKYIQVKQNRQSK